MVVTVRRAIEARQAIPEPRPNASTPEASTGTVIGVAAAAILAMAAGVVATTVGAPLLDQLAAWWDRLFGVV